MGASEGPESGDDDSCPFLVMNRAANGGTQAVNDEKAMSMSVHERMATRMQILALEARLGRAIRAEEAAFEGSGDRTGSRCDGQAPPNLARDPNLAGETIGVELVPRR